jgi:hypothetical protein
MTATVPDWLKARGAELRPSKDGHTWTVCFAGLPQYLLEPLPSRGKFNCRLTQTVNGRRLDGTGLYPTREEALQGGLDDLRKALGW